MRKFRKTGEPITVVITGSRNYNNYQQFTRLLTVALEGVNVKEVLQGGCRGTDYMAQRYCAENKITCVTHRAEWNKHGMIAGPMRNEQMAKIAHATIAFIGRNSKGTRDMISRAEKHRHEKIMVFSI